MNFKASLLRVDARLQVARLLGFVYCSGESIKPLLHEGCNPVAHWSGTPVELKRDTGEETATGEDLALRIREPAFVQTP